MTEGEALTRVQLLTKAIVQQGATPDVLSPESEEYGLLMAELRRLAPEEMSAIQAVTQEYKDAGADFIPFAYTLEDWEYDRQNPNPPSSGRAEALSLEAFAASVVPVVKGAQAAYAGARYVVKKAVEGGTARVPADVARQTEARIQLGNDAFREAQRRIEGQSAGSAGSHTPVQFGQTANQVQHTFRHTDALGLNRSLVQSSVQKDLRQIISQVPAGRPLNRVIEVGGQRIQYTAFKREGGVVNIGRIHGVP